MFKDVMVVNCVNSYSRRATAGSGTRLLSERDSDIYVGSIPAAGANLC